jgi:hypothetical protein
MREVILNYWNWFADLVNPYHDVINTISTEATTTRPTPTWWSLVTAFSLIYREFSGGERTRPGLGIIEPCLPSPAKVPPSGPGWIHEIKHDGFRILARRRPVGVRLITRNGNDFSHRFPFIEMAVKSLPVRSCLIDGEAIVCDENGLAVFELIRGHRTHARRK